MSNNIVIAKGVELIIRDMVRMHFWDMIKTRKGYRQRRMPLLQKGIAIRNNVIIGTNSLIMPGVTIGSVLLCRGTAVTKDVQDGIGVAGVPTRVFGLH